MQQVILSNAMHAAEVPGQGPACNSTQTASPPLIKRVVGRGCKEGRARTP